jgi:hypothetical protein
VLLGNDRNHLRRGNNRNILEYLEHEQILIAAHNRIGVGCNGTGEHRIIVRIATHPLGKWYGQNGGDKINVASVARME